MARKVKLLHYRRASFGETGESDNRTLEDYLSLAYGQKNRDDIKFSKNKRVYKNLAYHKDADGSFMHFTIYSPGEQASTVTTDAEENATDLEAADPPKGHEYIDGDCKVFVKGNHVIICSSRIIDSQIITFLCDIFKVSELGSRAESISLQKIAKIDTAKKIQMEGVKEIIMDSSIYSASLMNNGKSVKKKIFSGITGIIKSATLKDDPEESIKKLDSLSARVVISANGRIESALSEEKIIELANIVLKEEDGGFCIITKKGSLIKAGEIAVKKRVRMEPFGKTVFPNEALDAMREYMKELHDDGILKA